MKQIESRRREFVATDCTVFTRFNNMAFVEVTVDVFDVVVVAELARWIVTLLSTGLVGCSTTSLTSVFIDQRLQLVARL